MSKWRPKTCRDCGADSDDGAVISARGLCEDCGERRVIENVEQIMRKQGPNHDKWRAGMRKAANR